MMPIHDRLISKDIHKCEMRRLTAVQSKPQGTHKGHPYRLLVGLGGFCLRFRLLRQLIA